MTARASTSSAAGAGNRVHANHVYLTFDGINVGDSSVESLDIPLTRPDDGRDTSIDDNLIENTPATPASSWASAAST